MCLDLSVSVCIGVGPFRVRDGHSGRGGVNCAEKD